MQNKLSIYFTQQILNASRDLQISRLCSMKEIQISSNKQTNKTPKEIPTEFLLLFPDLATYITSQ